MELVESSTPDPTPTPPDETLAAHAEQFAKPPSWQEQQAQEKQDRDAKPKERHRASSQRATADDVEQINALTKDLRSKEAELAKIRPDALAGSPRLLALKRQIKAIEAELSEHAKPATPTPAAVTPPPVVKTESTAATFDEPEPTLEQFENAQPDPYTAYQRALARWDRRKEAFEEKQHAVAAQTKQQADERTQQIDTAYHERLSKFVAATPDFVEKFTAAEAEIKELPVLLIHALKVDDNGPALLYHLLTHPSDFDDMRLLTDGKPITEHSVALLRRRLSTLSRTQAVSTGSAVATAPQSLAPRPPNPVRTGPLKTGDDLPGDDASLAAHASAFHRSR